MSELGPHEELGVIPTVYSLVLPETRALFDQLRAESGLGEMYERAWTKRQDPMHHALLDAWAEWASPVIGDALAGFEHRYVSAGSSEAIRASIAEHTAHAFAEGREPRIHVFIGEYEGYRAYADAFRCKVVTHERDCYEESLRSAARPGDRFYLSAPSSLDGNVWSGLARFYDVVASLPELRVALDLCYVGCVGSGAYTIGVPSIVDTVFFSLSKVFGVYYHRIGGVFMRESCPALYGNIWFKNLLSLRYGTELLRRYDVFDLATRYRDAQESVCRSLGSHLGESVSPSDVLLLANQPAGTDETLDRVYARGTGVRRFCLSPALDRRLRA